MLNAGEHFINHSFYTRDVLEVAPNILGKIIVRKWPDGRQERAVITETEAYRGVDDQACHASKGRTKRTDMMYREGGVLYMYLIYGMHWMLNIVTAHENEPQAVLIRGVEQINGPGRLTRFLDLDGTFNGEHLMDSDRISIIDIGIKFDFDTGPRIGIDYAGDYWKSKPWRFMATL